MMFFGWNKLGKKTHLMSTWLVAIGANLSALWILVANAWMQYPAGTRFNPDMARNEMVNFWEVLGSPVAINKFFHTVTSGFVLASVFVVGVSAWFLLKGREQQMARRSITIAGIFGLIASVLVIVTGDGSSRIIAKVQPMKFAAAEGLHHGSAQAGLTVFGIPSQTEETKMKIELPGMLSWMTWHSRDSYVAGINDLVHGNPAQAIMSGVEKIERGQVARGLLRQFKDAKQAGNTVAIDSLRAQIEDPVFQREYFRYYGYGFLNSPQSLVPNVPLTFWSFRAMVICGFYFVILFAVALWLARKDRLSRRRWILWVMLFSIPLPYIAGQAGWIVAEVGRQPWAIQDYLPVTAAVSQIDASAVQLTFCLFAVIFVTLFIAELSIMIKQIRKGPAEQQV
jgi:cytochrome d ubiquinol oxidase subunit I